MGVWFFDYNYTGAFLSVHNRTKIQILFCLSVCLLLFILFLFSPYSLQLANWYDRYQIKRSLTCTGDNLLVEKVAKTALNSEQDLFNLSIAYTDKTGGVSTCVAGTQNHTTDSQPVTPSTVFLFASVTKVFTADTVLSLVREQKLSLEDKLVDILPELKNKTFKDDRVKDIRIKHLLSHTAGFDRTKPWVGDEMFVTGDPWCPNRVDELTKKKLEFTPNQYMSYSNVGYCLLSLVIEEKYQQPFNKVIKQKYHLDNYNNFDFLSSYDSYPKQNSAIITPPKEFNYPAVASVAGLYGSPTDLVTLVQAMEKTIYPNITSHQDDMVCDTAKFKACHGYMGYHTSYGNELTLYWRDGAIDNGMAMLIIDSKGGVMALTSNMRVGSILQKEILRAVYQHQLRGES